MIQDARTARSLCRKTKASSNPIITKREIWWIILQASQRKDTRPLREKYSKDDSFRSVKWNRQVWQCIGYRTRRMHVSCTVATIMNDGYYALAVHRYPPPILVSTQMVDNAVRLSHSNQRHVCIQYALSLLEASVFLRRPPKDNTSHNLGQVVAFYRAEAPKKICSTAPVTRSRPVRTGVKMLQSGFIATLTWGGPLALTITNMRKMCGQEEAGWCSHWTE